MQLINYKASNGIDYKVGSIVDLGTGTRDDQSFRYIHRYSPNYYNKDFNFNSNLPAPWMGQFMEVKKIKQSGKKSWGYKVYFYCGIPGSINYWIEIEGAIQAGEVVLPK